MKTGDKVRVLKALYPDSDIEQSLVGKTGVVTAVGTSGEQSVCVRFKNFKDGHSGESTKRSDNHWYFVPSALKVIRKKKVKKSR